MSDGFYTGHPDMSGKAKDPAAFTVRPGRVFCYNGKRFTEGQTVILSTAWWHKYARNVMAPAETVETASGPESSDRTKGVMRAPKKG